MFINAYFQGVDQEQDDPMDIIIELENIVVKKVLVDQGSFVDILHWVTYQKLHFSVEAMIPYDEAIYGFSRENDGAPWWMKRRRSMENIEKE